VTTIPQPLARERSFLLIVDLQARLTPAIADGEAVVAKTVFLAELSRRLGVPLVATEQNPAGLGRTVDALRPLIGDPFAKRHFAASDEPGFIERLPRNRSVAVVAGAEAHVCVLQTTSGLRRRGYTVAVVADAIGSRHLTDKEVALERMAAEGATIVTAEMVAFEWLGSCDDPEFKPIIGLVKRL
jgi:nicotinamidase-related amidase